MSRRLLCATCGDGKEPGVHTLYRRSPRGEPAEFGRYVWGIAKLPQPEQRVMRVNGTPIPLPLDAYDCDGCGAAIKPHERACAESIWTEDMLPPPDWESEYLTSS